MSKLQLMMILIPSLPLAAAILTAALGPRLLRERSHWVTIAALASSFVVSLLLLQQVSSKAAEQAASVSSSESIGYAETVTLWRWAQVEDAITVHDPLDEVATKRDFVIDVTLRADTLTAVMLVMVTFISTLVAIYARGYMEGERGYWRFFSYIGLFVFSMTMLVSVSNFLLLYVFWEAVGLCSYLLIGFWYEKPSASAAGKKAFLVNRVGDFGFALGLFLLWTTYGTFNFHDADGVAGILGQMRLADVGGGYVAGGVGLAICLLLLVGACGKSAQFPLHVWLPDAMEGPTPVSALIHAATMVTAGVYMVTRCTPLFHVSVTAQMVVATIGGFTALLAGLIAITQTDLKRVLAYSTVSQLGYMFLALGTGSAAGIAAGMFHLFTHAFFKALLFLGSGSVMHAMGGQIDMRYFGGLKRLMPITYWTFLIGCLALIGAPGLAGFYSKDLVLAAVSDRSHAATGFVHELFNVLFWAATFTAFLTAFYTFRAFFKTFHGPERIAPEAGHHAHESPGSMTLPLVILAICSIVVGFLFVSSYTEAIALTPSLAFDALVADGHGHASGGLSHGMIAMLGTMAAMIGVALSAYLYHGESRQADALALLLRPLYRLSLGKFFFDEIYTALFIWPLRALAAFCYVIDRYVVDGLVNLCGYLALQLGALLRRFQTGVLPFYALAMVFGFLVLVGALVVWPLT